MVKYDNILKVVKEKNQELRHDVDMSLDDAYMIAFRDYAHGIKSIFYVRVDCDYYNIKS